VFVTVRMGGAEVVEELEVVEEDADEVADEEDADEVADEEDADEVADEEDADEVADGVVVPTGAQSLVDDDSAGREPPTIISFLGRFEFWRLP